MIMTNFALLEGILTDGLATYIGLQGNHHHFLQKAMRTGDAKRIKAELSSLNILVQN